MIIYNKDKTEILPNDFDFSNGQIVADTLEVDIPQKQKLKENFHYEIIKEYSNKSKDVRKVVDSVEIEIIPPHKDTIKIFKFIPKE